MTGKPLPPLPLTRAAIAAYDDADAMYNADTLMDGTIADSLKGLRDLDRLGELVGEAYGRETADRNNYMDCKNLVRPGPRNPPGGNGDLSFVRKMVRLWEADIPLSEVDDRPWTLAVGDKVRREGRHGVVTDNRGTGFRVLWGDDDGVANDWEDFADGQNWPFEILPLEDIR